MTKIEFLNKQFIIISKPLYVKLALLLMVVSYFYNLPVFEYSVEGSNELRLYDIVGVLILFIVFNNSKVILYYIRSKPYLKYLNTFILWSGFTLIFTGIFSIFLQRPLWFVQTCLYYYHFIIFFYTAVLTAIYLRQKKNYKYAVNIILLLAIAEAILVFLQHYGFVSFLWNPAYEEVYDGFLSGTLGPNKIVLGMVMFFSFVISIAMFMQRKLKINKILILTCAIVSLAAIGISGSRTTYLALLIFTCYIFVSKTKKFLGLSLVLSVIIIIVFFLNLELIETITTTVENRVINKVSDPNLLDSSNIDVEQLYEDLGSGRSKLFLLYLEYISLNPYVIPIGIGLNNRLLISASAHNIYLSLINEVGLVGLFLYFKWITSYLYLKFGKMKELKIALNGLIISMLVTLFFGEHLYIYRSLFATLGYFLLATVILIMPRYHFNEKKRK